MSELDRLTPIVGTRLTRVRRVFHALDDEVDRSDGGVELQFSSGHTVYGDSGADGDSLSVEHAEWVDPFEGRMTPENVRFVRESGKPEAFDVSDEPPYRDLVGGDVMDVCEIVGTTGKRIGLVFVIAGEMFTVWVNSDETFATVLR